MQSHGDADDQKYDGCLEEHSATCWMVRIPCFVPDFAQIAFRQDGGTIVADTPPHCKAPLGGLHISSCVWREYNLCARCGQW